MWGLLLPVTSRGRGGEREQPLSEVLCSLRGFWESVCKTTTEVERSSRMKIWIGIDEDDTVLDTGEGHAAVASVFRGEVDFGVVRVTPPNKQPPENASVSSGGCGQLSSAGAAANENNEGQVCRVWRQLAQDAFRQGADYTVLLGDDIRLLSPGWTGDIHDEFTSSMYQQVFETCAGEEERGRCFGNGVAGGFGVVCFMDETSPGFPGFPVLHRTHMEIFPEIFPADFVNQDADPWIFEVYNRFGAARLMPTARLRNMLGGCEGDTGRDSSLASLSQPRYRKVPVNWKEQLLGDGVERVRAWLDSTQALPQLSPGERFDGGRRRQCRFDRFVVLDVLVPTVRLDDLAVLKAICSLDVPKYMRTMFIIIVDDPTIVPTRMREIADDLQRAARRNIVRVRQNKANMGAGPSRNRALDESSADYVLFLDDDVLPNGDVLAEYGRCVIRTEADEEGSGNSSGVGGTIADDRVPVTTGDTQAASTTCCGRIGMTRFPPAETALHRAVVLSDVTYMYRVSGVISHPAWGVTANLLVRLSWPGKRRACTRFGNQFPKTGGGEDVDFCLRHAADTGGSFVRAPEAVVTHPWWPGGRFKTYSRFFRWSSGDGQLLSLHRQNTYWSYPNVAESMLVVPVCVGVCFLAQLAFDFFRYGSEGGGSGGGRRSETSERSCSSDDILRSLAMGRIILLLVLMELAVVLSEMICDTIRNTWGDRVTDRLPGISLSQRVIAAMESSCVITVLEAGRVFGHWCRGGLGLKSLIVRHGNGAGRGVAGNFCRRFDWHCGRLAGAVENERSRAFLKILLVSVLLALLQLSFFW